VPVVACAGDPHDHDAFDGYRVEQTLHTRTGQAGAHARDHRDHRAVAERSDVRNDVAELRPRERELPDEWRELHRHRAHERDAVGRLAGLHRPSLPGLGGRIQPLAGRRRGF
jgi:hypothetical protein